MKTFRVSKTLKVWDTKIMTSVGGKFTTKKRNLVTYIEYKHYERLRQLAELHDRSVSAEAAAAIDNHLEKYAAELKEAALKK